MIYELLGAFQQSQETNCRRNREIAVLKNDAEERMMVIAALKRDAADFVGIFLLYFK
jgi:hypothetical protein